MTRIHADHVSVLDDLHGRTDIDGLGAFDDGFATTAVGWFEACVEHRGDHADGPCETCGWLAVDHTAGLAEIIVVGRRSDPTTLRRAS